MAKHKKHRSNKEANLTLEMAFLYMLSIPVKVLSEEYWSKTAKRKAPEFIEKCLEVYGRVQNGDISNEELAKSLEDMAGIKISADWLRYDKQN